MKSTMIACLCIVFLAGCLEAHAWMKADKEAWQRRHASRSDGTLKTGMTVTEFMAIWGKAADSRYSQFEQGNFVTLIYHDHRYRGLRQQYPQRSYYFDFINGRLTSWHEL